MSSDTKRLDWIIAEAKVRLGDGPLHSALCNIHRGLDARSCIDEAMSEAHEAFPGEFERHIEDATRPKNEEYVFVADGENSYGYLRESKEPTPTPSARDFVDSVFDHVDYCDHDPQRAKMHCRLCWTAAVAAHDERVAREAEAEIREGHADFVRRVQDAIDRAALGLHPQDRQEINECDCEDAILRLGKRRREAAAKALRDLVTELKDSDDRTARRRASGEGVIKRRGLTFKEAIELIDQRADKIEREGGK